MKRIIIVGLLAAATVLLPVTVAGASVKATLHLDAASKCVILGTTPADLTKEAHTCTPATLKKVEGGYQSVASVVEKAVCPTNPGTKLCPKKAAATGPAKYKATVTATQALSSSKFGVAFQVKNIGGAKGTPSCQVTAAASASNGGVNIPMLDAIGPGQYDYVSISQDVVSVSGNAAHQVQPNNGGVAIVCK